MSKRYKYKSKFGSRNLRRRILVYAEGKTECAYLNKHKTRLQTGVRVEIIHVNKNKLSLLKKVVSLVQQEYIEGDDEVWVVLDRDKEPGDKSRFQEAMNLAKEEQIKVAYSNNAFEVWPLLHFQDILNPMSNTDLKRSLDNYFKPKYSKDGKMIHRVLSEQGNYPLAFKRADVLLERHKNNGVNELDANPSTTIHHLIESIKGHGIVS